jgi:hypothetical protein
VIANPPFNDSDWSGDLLRGDARWRYGEPQRNSANYAWIQHFLHHMSPGGQAGFVLAKGALTSKTSGEGDIRKALVGARLLDCIVNLPGKLFLNTQIPASLWFLSRNRSNGIYRNRREEILFIDARNLGHLINRRTLEFTDEDIAQIAGTYHNWRNPDGDYEDVPGFCNAAALERVRELDNVLTPGRYVGLAEEEDDFDFAERFSELQMELEAQLAEEDRFQRQNRTLEALVQTLFRHWFIDGAEDDWAEVPLDKAADYLNGLACQKYPPENDVDRLPVLKIQELRGGVSDKTDWATTQVPEQYIVENSDVIFSWSGSLMVKKWDGERCVLNQHLFKVTSDRFSKWFYWLWTAYHLRKFVAISESKATTMGHIKWRDLSNSMLLVPSSDELAEMDQVFSPLVDKMILNNRQMSKLTTLRYTLLPKLMSGEVRVRL